MNISELLEPIDAFLYCQTPQSWVDEAIKPENFAALIIDHANCELKAAQTAMLLLRRYAVDQKSSDALLAWLKPYEDFVYRKIGNGDFSDYINLSKNLMGKSDFEHSDELISKMVLLIKEELHHFQQVWEIMQSRGVTYDNQTASGYARGLMKCVRTHEPAKLSDTLICGAYIEARSCERFAKLAPYLDNELEKFYVSLLRSEARHFQDYLTLASNVSSTNIDQRVNFFGEKEAALIQMPDKEFRFHSGAFSN